MKKRITTMIMMTVLAGALFVGCGSVDTLGSSGDTEASEAEYLVGFANNSDTYNYCAKFRAYLKEETEAKGISIMVTDAGGDTNVQNGQIDDFIVQNAKVVSAISNDTDGSVPALEAAKAAGIPYISFLTSVNGGNDYEGYIYVGSPNYDAGKAQGDYLCEVLPENAQILYFTFDPNDQQYVDRKQGLLDSLAARSDIQILDEYTVKGFKDLGMSAAEDCLMSYDSFDAIVCQNDDSALGVVEALKSAGKMEDVLVIGVDGSDDALTSIKNGELAMTAFQDARAQAQAGADVFEQLKNGTPPGEIEDVYVPFKIVSAENVDEYLQ